ncbi:MAG: 2,3-cyclic phosphodiesterase [Frankiales bacterium]|nr:2,3-cyclic phosphodiesterase [Frankiales bacterium]
MRLFVALRPPAAAIADLKARLPRWPSAPERWHLTLAFLGELPGPQEVHDQLLTVRSAAFDLRLEGSGTFGRQGPVWVGVGGDVDALHDLQADVARAVQAAGVQLERKAYRPHLTVGRRGHPNPAVLAEYRGPQWRASEVELVRSDVGKDVVHTVRERYPLR